MDKTFKLSQNNTNIKTEIIAGFTTFVTMAYIITAILIMKIVLPEREVRS
jgi:xanthine/uracil/vitamin C permease (AzgA family)